MDGLVFWDYYKAFQEPLGAKAEEKMIRRGAAFGRPPEEVINDKSWAESTPTGTGRPRTKISSRQQRRRFGEKTKNGTNNSCRAKNKRDQNRSEVMREARLRQQIEQEHGST